MMRVATEAFLEVDANLRPEGRSGQLVRTLEAHVAYYQRWARTWEFQALLKARPVAGDLALGQEYCEALAPMVWSAAERDDFVADVRAMRRRVEDHIRHDHADRELKLGRGGLRDVEFAVQLLQLVHGRGDDTLRSPTPSRPSRRSARAGTWAATTPRTSPRPTGSCGCSSTGCSCRSCAAPTCSPPTTTPRACAGSRGRRSCVPTGAATRSGCCRPSAPAHRPGPASAREALLPAAARVGGPGAERAAGPHRVLGDQRLAALGWSSLRRGALQARGGADRRDQPGRADPAGAHAGAARPARQHRRPRPTACSPTARSPRRSRRRRGSSRCCATRASPPTGCATCWAPPAGSPR